MPVQLSRAWNRAYLQAEYLAGSEWKVLIAGRYRAVYNANNNEDIERFLGRGHLSLEVMSPSDSCHDPVHRFYLFMRKGFNGGTETYEADYDLSASVLPWSSTSRGWYLRFHEFSGYGESLIDYNRKITKVAFGFVLH